MAKHHPDLVMCRKQPGVAIGRLCEKCEFPFFPLAACAERADLVERESLCYHDATLISRKVEILRYMH